MAEAVAGLGTIIKPCIRVQSLKTTTSLDVNFSCPRSLRQCSGSSLFGGDRKQIEGMRKGKRECLRKKANALPDWPLMAVLVETLNYDVKYIVHKSITHLSDREIKSVYVAYMMFTCWGCLVFGSMKDPFYDSEQYRKDGGDGTGFWVYEKQEDIEEKARAELWKEELIEEIEQKVGGIRELEEAGKK